MKFYKYHALGNDYLVLDPENTKTVPNNKNIRRICHRNYGLGSDGILYGPENSNIGDFGLRIFNPDGSEAEKSGLNSWEKVAMDYESLRVTYWIVGEFQILHLPYLQ